jgi:hypothetical protein
MGAIAVNGLTIFTRKKWQIVNVRSCSMWGAAKRMSRRYMSTSYRCSPLISLPTTAKEPANTHRSEMCKVLGRLISSLSLPISKFEPIGAGFLEQSRSPQLQDGQQNSSGQVWWFCASVLPERKPHREVKVHSTCSWKQILHGMSSDRSILSKNSPNKQ